MTILFYTINNMSQIPIAIFAEETERNNSFEALKSMYQQRFTKSKMYLNIVDAKTLEDLKSNIVEE